VGKPQKEVEPLRDDLRNLRKALGNRIRELRTTRAWSQEDFSTNAHIHRTFAGSLERGEKNCSFHALVLIARSFGITLSELFKGLETGEPLQHKRVKPDTLDWGRIRSEIEILERAVHALRKFTEHGAAPAKVRPRKP